MSHERRSPGRTTILRRRALASFVLYAFDMAMALTAFIFGFGLTVQNWWALVLLGVINRWFFSIPSSSLMYATERERAGEDAAAAE